VLVLLFADTGTGAGQQLVEAALGDPQALRRFFVAAPHAAEQNGDALALAQRGEQGACVHHHVLGRDRVGPGRLVAVAVAEHGGLAGQFALALVEADCLVLRTTFSQAKMVSRSGCLRISTIHAYAHASSMFSGIVFTRRRTLRMRGSL